MVELLGFIGAVIVNSGLPVFLANFLKYIFPSMDGQTDKVVNVMITVLFAVIFVYSQFFSIDFIYQWLPQVGDTVKNILQVASLIIALLVPKALAPGIYGLVRNRIPVFGKSFNRNKLQAKRK